MFHSSEKTVKLHKCFLSLIQNLPAYWFWFLRKEVLFYCYWWASSLFLSLVENCFLHTLVEMAITVNSVKFWQWIILLRFSSLLKTTNNILALGYVQMTWQENVCNTCVQKWSIWLLHIHDYFILCSVSRDLYMSGQNIKVRLVLLGSEARQNCYL